MLPVINTATYKTIIPSTKKEISFRPFLVKEEKALLSAQQSEEVGTMISTLSTIIESCTLGNVKVDELSMSDIEWLLVQIRARSVGEVVDLSFKCDTCVDDKDAVMKVSIDLTKIELTEDPEHSKTIEFADGVGVIMKYPPLDTFHLLENAGDNVEDLFGIFMSCIESVYDRNSVYPTKDESKEDMTKFMDSLTKEQFNKMEHFFQTMPKLEKVIDYNCPVCHKAHTKTLSGFMDFFM